MNTPILVNCKVTYEYHEHCDGKPGHVLEVGTFCDVVVYIKEGDKVVYQNDDVITELGETA